MSDVQDSLRTTDSGGGRGLVGYFASNRVAANVLMLLLLGLGLFAANQLPKERFPQFDPRTITVAVPYPGAAAAEVEEDVNRRVEESLKGIVGVERVTSVALEGMGRITVELETFADAVDVVHDVRTAVERIENFPPADADRAEVVRDEPVHKAAVLAVSSSTLDEHELRLDAEALRDALLALPLVSFVSLDGARQREIQIELSEEALRRYGLRINEVVDQVRQSSLNLTGGELRTDAGELVISTFAKRTEAREFEDIVLIAAADGAIVRLRDVATVREGFVEEPLISEIDGVPTVFVRVDAGAGQGVQRVAEEVKRFAAGYMPPPGTSVSLWEDVPERTSYRISIIASNAVIGAVLVFLALLAIFDLRIALWIAMGIPISFLGALVFFDATGMTINQVTVFGFFIVTGIVVDDAVVVGESIARQRELGQKGLAASIAGVRAVAGPVLVGALTTIVTFFALFPLDDAWGQLFRVMPVVVALVLAVSLVEVFCILPAHLAGPGSWSLSPLRELQTRVRTAFEEFINGRLIRVIALAVRYPYHTVLAVLAAIVVALGLVATGVVGYTPFTPLATGDRIVAAVTMPQGTQFQVTEDAARHLADAARAVDRAHGGNNVQSIAVLVGGDRVMENYYGRQELQTGSHLATVEVKFNPSPLRTMAMPDYMQLWERAAGDVPGAEAVEFSEAAWMNPSTVSYLLIHRDAEVLAQAAADLRSAYMVIDAVNEVEDSLARGKRRYDIQLTEAGVAAGLTAAQVASQLRSAFFGAEAQRIQRGRDEIRVVVRYPEERRRSVGDLLDERIALPMGGEVPLATVARIVETQDYAQLLRVDSRRAATITAWIDPNLASTPQVNAKMRADTLPGLLARYPGLEVREDGQTRDNTKMIDTLAWSFALALIIVYGLLASQLRSFAQPLLALASMPLAVVGAIVGHLLLGYQLTNMSVFGIIAVSGVVVNDTLLLLDRYNRIRADDPDLPAIAAISAAARHRARAIVLTSVTTVVGLLPLLYDKSEVLQFMVPMVISLGAGLVFASLGVLFLVPAVVIIGDMVLFWSPLSVFSASFKPAAAAGPSGEAAVRESPQG